MVILIGITKEEMMKQRNERVGTTVQKRNGEIIKVIEYIDASHVIVEFQDDWQEKVETTWACFCDGRVRNPMIDKNKIGMIRYNHQNCPMKIIEYNNSLDILVEFQDDYKIKRRTTFNEFRRGNLKNPYFPSVYGVGIIGEKYPVSYNKKAIKEYNTWTLMLARCYCNFEGNERYEDVTCCKEWLLYENFYEWLHSQENFEQWLNGNKWDLDKDILFKGNKIYSPTTCCLVPHNVNSLFIKSNAMRGEYPIGVGYKEKECRYYARVSMVRNGKQYRKMVGRYPTPEDAFYLGYKPEKEKYIKKIAQEEYDKGNITQCCYEAMMNYKVEITD